MALTKNYYSIDGEIIGEATGGTRTGYLPDALGSVTATVDEGGTVVNTYRYKPYGAQLSKTGASADPRFQWVGQSGYNLTPGANVTYVRSRSYLTGTSAWISQDPLWPSQQPYIYGESEPIGNTDYYGLRCDCRVITKETRYRVFACLRKGGWEIIDAYNPPPGGHPGGDVCSLCPSKKCGMCHFSCKGNREVITTLAQEIVRSGGQYSWQLRYSCQLSDDSSCTGPVDALGLLLAIADDLLDLPGSGTINAIIEAIRDLSKGGCPGNSVKTIEHPQFDIVFNGKKRRCMQWQIVEGRRQDFSCCSCLIQGTGWAEGVGTYPIMIHPGYTEVV